MKTQLASVCSYGLTEGEVEGGRLRDCAEPFGDQGPTLRCQAARSSSANATGSYSMVKSSVCLQMMTQQGP